MIDAVNEILVGNLASEFISESSIAFSSAHIVNIMTNAPSSSLSNSSPVHNAAIYAINVC